MAVFLVLAVLMTLGALGVVTMRRPVHAALSLVFTLLVLAVAYLQLHAPFLAAVQVIVYAGAIMVLFLFVIMLLNVGGDPVDTPDTLRWLRPAGWLAALLAIGGLSITIMAQALPDANIGAAIVVLQSDNVHALADVLFGRYVLAFQLVGVLLLTGMIAAVGLVKQDAESAPDEQERAGMPLRTPGETPPADRGEAGATLGGGR